MLNFWNLVKSNQNRIFQLLLIIIAFKIFQFAYLQYNKLKTNWLFVYYMPYDNSLSLYGEPIINMIASSISSDNVIATIQSDFDDTNGMKRYIITSNSINVSSINDEYSASSKSYEDYLRWVIETVDFNNLAIVFLDHGGKLNELCLDEQPLNNFLKIDSLKLVFNRVFGENRIDLLFLQVCSKGSIEPIYEFRDIAKYTLCSQIEIGAPNYYYYGLFTELSNDQIKNGLDVANSILLNEAYDMYNSFTLIDNTKLDSLYIMFENFTIEIENLINVNLISMPSFSSYLGEKYCDIISVLNNMDLDDYPALESQKKQIISFISEEVIINHKISPYKKHMSKYSGLSMSSDTKGKEYNNLEFYVLLKSIREKCIKK